MLKEIEKLFGFRTNDETNVELYLRRMDEMSKFDDNKRNRLIAALIKRVIVQDQRITSLEQANEVVERVIEQPIKIEVPAVEPAPESKVISAPKKKTVKRRSKKK